MGCGPLAVATCRPGFISRLDDLVRRCWLPTLSIIWKLESSDSVAYSFGTMSSLTFALFLVIIQNECSGAMRPTHNQFDVCTPSSRLRYLVWECMRYWHSYPDIVCSLELYRTSFRGAWIEPESLDYESEAFSCPVAQAYCAAIGRSTAAQSNASSQAVLLSLLPSRDSKWVWYSSFRPNCQRLYAWSGQHLNC